ncbi:hypothetical protein BJX64DRAFT_251235 [Aspergillus heterothallicus]
MPTYRIEESPTSRAGCQNKECKDAKKKIPKGEVRVGTWVDTEKVQAFMWRHWGCVTPKIISNLNEVIGEGDDRDLDLLDGYEDLSEENQQKLAKALDQGHVDDEEWNGDAEMNRPGKFGYRVRGGKKKADKAAHEEKTEESEEEESKKSKKALKHRKRSRFDIEEDEEEDEKPKPKRKPTGYPKDVPPASDEEVADEEEEEKPMPAKTKPRAAKRGGKAKEEGAAAPAAKRAKRAKKNDDNAEDKAVTEKPKRGRRKKTT